MNVDLPLCTKHQLSLRNCNYTICTLFSLGAPKLRVDMADLRLCDDPEDEELALVASESESVDAFRIELVRNDPCA